MILLEVFYRNFLTKLFVFNSLELELKKHIKLYQNWKARYLKLYNLNHRPESDSNYSIGSKSNGWLKMPKFIERCGVLSKTQTRDDVAIRSDGMWVSQDIGICPWADIKAVITKCILWHVLIGQPWISCQFFWRWSK